VSSDRSRSGFLDLLLWSEDSDAQWNILSQSTERTTITFDLAR